MQKLHPKPCSQGDAVLLYKNGDADEAKEMMLRASECYGKKRAWHSAAKTLEQAMAIDQKKVREEGRKKWVQLFSAKS